LGIGKHGFADGQNTAKFAQFRRLDKKIKIF
jgi:hypothetical protein